MIFALTLLIVNLQKSREYLNQKKKKSFDDNGESRIED